MVSSVPPSLPASSAPGVRIGGRLVALAFATFSVGTSKAVLTGILPAIAQDLGVSVARAGILVSAHDLALAVGAPVVIAATASLPRRTLLLGLMGAVVVGDALMVITRDFWPLVLLRAVSAPFQGSVIATTAVVATRLVPPSHRGRAIAMTLIGMVLAYSAGIPLAAWISQLRGWRAVFVVIALLQGVAFVAVVLAVRGVLVARERTATGLELRALREPRVIIALSITVVTYAGLLTINTYIVPFLTQHAGVPRSMIPLALSVLGIAPLAGTLLGGRLSDRAPSVAVVSALVLTMVGLLLMWQLAGQRVGMLVVMGCTAVAASTLTPALEAWIVAYAPHAPTLASALRLSAVNFGMAIGAGIGGMTLALGHDYGALAAVAALVTGVALVMSLWTLIRERRRLHR